MFRPRDAHGGVVRGRGFDFTKESRQTVVVADRIRGVVELSSGGRRPRLLLGITMLYLLFVGAQRWEVLSAEAGTEEFDPEGRAPVGQRPMHVFSRTLLVLTRTPKWFWAGYHQMLRLIQTLLLSWMFPSPVGSWKTPIPTPSCAP